MTTDIKTPVSIITGFLGSGKTTLINHLIQLPVLANSIVLVNEFGEISIDSDLIKKSGDSVVELKNGCVCCSLNEELGITLRDFKDQRTVGNLPPFDKVLVETTGLANAGPIVGIIMEDPQVRDEYDLDKVITTVDSMNGVTNLNVHAESVEQVAIADRLILTKLDMLVDPKGNEDLAELRARLHSLNPSAPVLDGSQGVVDAAAIFNERPDEELVRYTAPEKWAPEPHDLGHQHNHHEVHDDRGHAISIDARRHDHHIKSFCIVRDQPITQNALKVFWTALGNMAGPNLLRVKGLVNVAEHPDAPAVIQSVREVFDDMRWMDGWPSKDRRTRIVIIGWMIDQDRIEDLLFEASN